MPKWKDALLDSTALRRFVGIDLGRERVPDSTTLLKFRRLLETHKLGEALFAQVGAVLPAHGLMVGTGTIVDRDDHRRAKFDEERRQAPGPRDAPDAQGPAVVLRHEAWALQREDGSWLLDGHVPISELKDRLKLETVRGEARCS